MEFININDAMARLNNNKKFYIRLLGKFDVTGLLDDLLDKVKNGDAEAAQSASHAIKGIAANLSLDDLRAKSEAIDAQLKDGDTNVDTAPIELSVVRTTEAVKSWLAENS